MLHACSLRNIQYLVAAAFLDEDSPVQKGEVDQVPHMILGAAIGTVLAQDLPITVDIIIASLVGEGILAKTEEGGYRLTPKGEARSRMVLAEMGRKDESGPEPTEAEADAVAAFLASLSGGGEGEIGPAAN